MHGTDTDAQPPRSGLIAAYSLALLFIANMLNYADRALLGVIVEPIRKELHLSDGQLGVLQGFAFSLFFLIAGIAIARWVDRGNRRLILLLGVALWSVATAATGLAHDFYSLALTRVVIGVGEATVFPVAMSLLADFYPGPKLSRSASIFQASSGVGILVGSILAGLLASTLGWRSVFLLFGAGGVALIALIFFTLHPTPRRLSVLPDARAKGLVPAVRELLATVGSILAIPGMPWLALGFGFSNMALACLPLWGPAFLQRSHHVPLDAVGAMLAPPAVLGAVLGNLVSGTVATQMIKHGRGRSAGLIVPIIALPIAVPAYALFLFAPALPVALAGAGVMNFMLTSSLGPCVALAVSMVEPGRRATASTTMLIAQTLTAFTLGPWIIGYASDVLTASQGQESLRYALALLLAAPLVASLLLLRARQRILQE